MLRISRFIRNTPNKSSRPKPEIPQTENKKVPEPGRPEAPPRSPIHTRPELQKQRMKRLEELTKMQNASTPKTITPGSGRTNKTGKKPFVRDNTSRLVFGGGFLLYLVYAIYTEDAGFYKKIGNPIRNLLGLESLPRQQASKSDSDTKKSASTEN